MTDRMSKLREEGEARRVARRAQSPEERVQNALPASLASHRPKIAFRLSQMPEDRRQTYLKAMGGKRRQLAIQANCDMCMGWHRKDVTSCTDPACPLFPYRPYQD